MIYRQGEPSDFQHIETFVWQAIFPAYDHPDLNEVQRASNDAIVENARAECSAALQHPEKWVVVAYDEKRKELAAYAIVHQISRSEAQLLQFIVARRHWSKGVAQDLFSLIGERLVACSRLLLSVHYYNSRAISFFEKQGCVPTVALEQEAIIPQIWLDKDWQSVFEQLKASASVQAELGEEIDLCLLDEPAWFEPEEATEKKPEVAEEEWKLALEELLGTTFEDVREEEEVSQELARPAEEAVVKDFTFHYSAGERRLLWPRRQPERNRTKASIKPISFEFVWGEEAEEEETASFWDGQSVGIGLDEEQEGPSMLLDDMGGGAVEVEWDIMLPQKEKVILSEEVKKAAKNQERQAQKQSATEQRRGRAGQVDLSLPSIKELRTTFRELLYDFASRLFGDCQAKSYVELSEAAEFELLLESALNSLLSALQAERFSVARAEAQGAKRIRYTCEELAEYLIVGFGSELHRGLFPEALLRYQASVWGHTDLFGMVNTYLNLEQEYEVVYRDFITMPSRKLRNATRNFLLARPQEVIYFIVDQSLLGNASNGFACTNRSLYWKNPLQPNHAIFFSDLKSIKIASSCLWINGHFFDAGYSINLKLALLLEKIRRMQP